MTLKKAPIEKTRFEGIHIPNLFESLFENRKKEQLEKLTQNLTNCLDLVSMMKSYNDYTVNLLAKERAKKAFWIAFAIFEFAVIVKEILFK